LDAKLQACPDRGFLLASLCLETTKAKEIYFFSAIGPIKNARWHMLYWAVVFLIVAIIAGILGFGGIAAAAAGMAKILFYIFLIIFLITLIMGLSRRSRI